MGLEQMVLGLELCFPGAGVGWSLNRQFNLCLIFGGVTAWFSWGGGFEVSIDFPLAWRCYSNGSRWGSFCSCDRDLNTAK